VVFTGSIFGAPGEVRSFPPDLLAGLRVLVTGSDSDEWIPEASTRETARLLSELGAEVRLRVYKGRPHIVSPEELAEARDFIRALAA
jgi:phospholipase/carboxylesterase